MKNSKKFISYNKALTLLKSKNTIMMGGFMGVGSPHKLIDYMVKSSINDLNVICNDGGFGICEQYKDGFGLGKLIIKKKVSSLIATHIGLNKQISEQIHEGSLKVTLFPQGSFIEKIRCGAFGLGGILTPTGIGSEIVEKGKKIITLHKKDYILEEPLKGDIALVGAKKADKYGNIVFHGTTRNFGEMMLYACDENIVEVEEIVDELDPDFIHVPYCFVHHIVVKGKP